MVVRPGLDLRYERLVGECNTVSRPALFGIGGAGFTDPGALEGRNRVSIAVGVAVDLDDRWSASLGCQGEISGASQAHGVQAGVTFRF